jgi:hypothetical protein
VNLLFGVRIHFPLAAYGKSHIYESTIVNDPFLSPPLGGLLLFLLFDFGGLRLDFAGAGKRSVNFSHVIGVDWSMGCGLFRSGSGSVQHQS